VSLDPAKEQLREMKKITDLFGELVRVQKNLLQETRATHISILELTRRLVPDEDQNDEEDQESQSGPQ
jgi:hypothetical protein